MIGPTAYNSGNSGELVTSLPLSDGAPVNKRVVYCIDLLTPPIAGEILHVTAEMEATNDLGYNVAMVSQLLLTDTATATSGYEISEANGFNITPDMHHGMTIRVGTLTVPAGSTRRFVVLVAWAESTAAQPGHALTIEQDYGRLSVLRWT